MSRVLKEDIEGRTMSVIGPVCWMSPESIAKQVYSKKSDVWMFGMVVYEIVAQHEPHSDKNPFQVSRDIRFNLFRATNTNELNFK
jgi:serine/threonine protein kinase